MPEGVQPDSLDHVNEKPEQYVGLSVDKLNGLVTEAMHRAVGLEGAGEEEHEAWGEVSKVEAALADLLPPDKIEGEIARRDAVRAAVASGDIDLAQNLADGYLAEPGISEALSDEIREMVRMAKLERLAESFKKRVPNEMQGS